MSNTATDHKPNNAIAWQNLQDAILQERFDDLPEVITARDFAAFSAEPIELIRDAIKNGDIIATRDDGLVAIPKDANERLIRYRLVEDTAARIVERPAAPELRRLSTHMDHRILDLVRGLAADSGSSVRELVEEALLSYWGPETEDAVAGGVQRCGRPAGSGLSSPS
ncbi:hypothetical protein ACPPVQ_18225 [Diaminobutyricibacter sp. McL0618]|uniref:hypothetical protein n=1 Tax=Leifsonia sp. McL0618 TaxID=3415677 RepID=UPI003CFB293F